HRRAFRAESTERHERYDRLAGSDDGRARAFDYWSDGAAAAMDADRARDGSHARIDTGRMRRWWWRRRRRRRWRRWRQASIDQSGGAELGGDGPGHWQ